ncbi:MAG: arginine N-succinyltransferase [Tatlockia sp.]|nr:arginine N-succinyltransferase [Tatlockia sp.]
MMLFRSALESDLDAIHQLAEHCGFGLTSLPKNIEILRKRLAWSCSSFQKKVKSPSSEYYLFVLEDSESSEIVGTSAIEATTGHDLPLYSYRVLKRTRICHSLNIRSDYEILDLVNDNQGRSELCTLFLKPEFRHDTNGLLLARARFLFIANYPQRFAPIIIAELRGISDELGNSPFWDSVGQHFFHMTFAEADAFTVSTNKQFIADLMPRSPIYVKLLPPEAQAVIGHPHHSAVPAMKLLLHEGFRFNSTVDIFDAGPTIESPLDQIRTIADNRLMTITSLSDEVSSKLFLIANTKLDFRATIAMAIFKPQKGTCIIGKKTAELLQVQQGDCLRIAPSLV